MAIYLNLGLDPKAEIIKNFVIVAEKRVMKFLNILS